MTFNISSNILNNMKYNQKLIQLIINEFYCRV